MKMIEISITGVEFLLHKKVYTNILNKSREYFFPKHNKNSEASYLTLTAHLPSSKKHYKNTENLSFNKYNGEKNSVIIMIMHKSE